MSTADLDIVDSALAQARNAVEHALRVVAATKARAAEAPLGNERLLTRDQAAEKLGMSTRTLDRKVACGEVRSVKDGGARKFRLADLEAHIARLAAGGAE